MPGMQTKLIVNPNADLGRAWRTVSDLRDLQVKLIPGAIQVMV